MTKEIVGLSIMAFLTALSAVAETGSANEKHQRKPADYASDLSVDYSHGWGDRKSEAVFLRFTDNKNKIICYAYRPAPTEETTVNKKDDTTVTKQIEHTMSSLTCFKK